MVSRIKQLLDWQQLSPTQFADRIGIGRPVISHILSERNKPSLEVMRSIKAAFPEVSTDWLLDGLGPMLAAAVPVAAPTVAPAPAAAPAAMPPVATPAAPVLPAPTASVPQASAAPVALPVPAVAAAAVPAAGAMPLDAPAAPVEPARPFVAPVAAPRPAIARFAPGRGKEALQTAPILAPPLVEGFASVAELPPPAPAVAPVAPPAAAEMLPVMPPVAAPTLASPPAIPSLADVFGEPGKAIRRIVIFYRDGSFADYQPEG